MEVLCATDASCKGSNPLSSASTYRTMEVQQTSNLRIIVRLYVGVRQNVSEAHVGEQPTVNRKEVSSNLT